MLDAIALWSSVGVCIVGLAFMAKCKALYANSATLPAFKGVGFSSEVGGLFGHFTFILGVLAWVVGELEQSTNSPRCRCISSIVVRHLQVRHLQTLCWCS